MKLTVITENALEGHKTSKMGKKITEGKKSIRVDFILNGSSVTF